MQRRALIINDERATSEMIARLLYTAGIEALSVTRNSDVFGFLQEGKFDVIFMDFHLAAPNDAELVRGIRAAGPNRAIPIILFSDDTSPSALAHGFEAGANFFLYKPIDQRSLLRLVRAAQGAMDHERRRTRRIPVRSRVLLQTGSQELEGETIDVSLTGLKVKMPTSLPVGSEVRLSLYPAAASRPITGAGSVVRLAGPGQMGILLKQFSPIDSQRLEEFLLPLIPTQ